jgi:hypothetical protein
MAEQTITRDEMRARRELLVCRTCDGEIWHFHAQEAPSAPGSAVLVGYRCAGCGARIDVSVVVSQPPSEHDGASDGSDHSV